jgi:hypothetical protein
VYASRVDPQHDSIVQGYLCLRVDLLITSKIVRAADIEERKSLNATTFEEFESLNSAREKALSDLAGRMNYFGECVAEPKHFGAVLRAIKR